MISGWWLWKDLEGSGRGVIEVTSRDTWRREEKLQNYKKTSEWAVPLPRLHCRTILNYLFCPWMNIGEFLSFFLAESTSKNEYTLSPNVFMEIKIVFLSFSTIFYFISLESTIV